MASAVYPLPALSPRATRAPPTPTTVDHIDALPLLQLRRLATDENSLLDLVSQFGYTRSIADNLNEIRKSIQALKVDHSSKQEEYEDRLSERIAVLDKLREEVGVLSKEKNGLEGRFDADLKRALAEEVARLEDEAGALDEFDGEGDVGKYLKMRVDKGAELYRVRIRRDAFIGGKRAGGHHDAQQDVWGQIRWTRLQKREAGKVDRSEKDDDDGNKENEGR